MGILAQHVPSIEQLKPGLVEIIEESGGRKQFFCEHLLLLESAELLLVSFKLCFEHVLTLADLQVSGGFAVVQPGSQLSINAVEGFPLEDFSSDVRSIHLRPFDHRSPRRRRSPVVGGANKTLQKQRLN